MVNSPVTLKESMRVGGPTRQDKATIAVSAIHIAPGVYLQPNAGMAKGRPAGNVACAVAGHTTRLDGYGFRLVDHGRAISNHASEAQPDQK